MNLGKKLVVFLAACGLSAFSVDSSAQVTKVTASYVSDSAGVLPLWLGKEAGIFARNGLDVQAVRVHAAVGVMALVSGELQFVLASGPVVVDSALRGSGAVYLAGGLSTLDFVLVTRPEIKTAEQLKGGTVGLSAFRGANPAATRFALQKLGLAPKDVAHVKSHLEAIALMKTDRELAIKTLGKYLGQIKERDVLVKSYESAAADNRISRKQYPNLAGLQMALDLVAEDNPKAKTAKPEEFVDSRFIKELDDNGYIDNLYKNKGRP